MSLVEYSKRETPAAGAWVVGCGPGDPFLPPSIRAPYYPDWELHPRQIEAAEAVVRGPHPTTHAPAAGVVTARVTH